MIDWNTIVALTGVVTAIVAIVALIIEIRQSRVALEVDMVMEFNEKLDSEEIREFRKVSAEKLLEGKSSYISELEKLLDFFAIIATLVERKVISLPMAYDQFSWWMVRYWVAALPSHIRESRSLDPQSFMRLEKIVEKLMKYERKIDPSVNFSDEKIREFLQNELNS